MLFHVRRRESIRIEPGDWIIELHVSSGMAWRISCGHCAVKLRLEFMGVKIRRRNAQLLRGLGQRGDSVIGGERDPHVGQANLMPEKVEKIGELAIQIESHGLHFWRVRSYLVAENVVRGKADNQQIRRRAAAYVFVDH